MKAEAVGCGDEPGWQRKAKWQGPQSAGKDGVERPPGEEVVEFQGGSFRQEAGTALGERRPSVCGRQPCGRWPRGWPRGKVHEPETKCAAGTGEAQDSLLLDGPKPESSYRAPETA